MSRLQNEAAWRRHGQVRAPAVVRRSTAAGDQREPSQTKAATPPWVLAAGCAALIAAAGLAAGCGGTEHKFSPTAPTVNISMSDSPVCGGAQGTYTHVWIAVSDIQASTKASAGANDPSLVDLTPNLKNAPVQIDLEALPNSAGCVLSALGTTTQIVPGAYAQLRLFLLDNSLAARLTTNHCGSPNAASCVQLASNSTIQPLEVSSEATTGIVISGDAITGNTISVASGQTLNLNFDFDGCASVIVDATGALPVYRLAPRVHAGLLPGTSSVSGVVVDGNTGVPITNARVIVALERADAAGIDRVVAETVADSTTAVFQLCGIPSGNLDLVATAVSGSNAYAPTVVSNVPSGVNAGNVQLFPGQGTNAQFAQVNGTISSTSASGPTRIDAVVSAIEQVDVSGAQVQVTIPGEINAASAAITTGAGSSCPANTDCGSFGLVLPGMNASSAIYSQGIGAVSTNNATPVMYTIEAQALVPSSGNAADCSPAVQTVSNLSVTAGGTFTATVPPFTGCQ